MLLSALALLTLRPAGAQSLDTALNAGANAEVYAVAIQLDGKILVGGAFTTLGGANRSRLARFNADGTLDPTFDPSANGTVYAIRLQPDGKILVGGDFQTVGTNPARSRAYLARLNPDGSADADFVQGTNASVRDFAVQTDGRVMVVGRFTQLAGAARTGIGRLNSNGTIDPTFNATVAGSINGAATTVETVVLTNNGQMLIGGNFSTVNNQPSAGASWMFADGTRSLFNPALNGPVYAIAFLPDGKFFLGGNFGLGPGQGDSYLRRYNADGTRTGVLVPAPNGPVRSLVLQPDGRLLIGGLFTDVGALRRQRLARFNADSSLDPTFFTTLGGSLGSATTGIYALALGGTGQLIVGGAFSSVTGVERNGIARFGSPLPKILIAPVSLFATPGATVTLAVVASGENLRYQWKLEDVDVAGATSATLTLRAVQTPQTGAYTVAVSNDLGTSLSTPAQVTLGTPPPPVYTISNIAGTPNVAGGPPGNLLDRPLGIAVTRDGAVLVMDSNVIREITPPGKFIGVLTGLAGWGLALDSNNNIYVADADTRIARITRNGVVSTFAGAPTRGSNDGPAATARFSMPRGVAVDSADNVYVADSDNFTIRKITPSGIVSTIAGLAGARDLVDGPGSAARFIGPWGLAIDSDRTLYVADRATVRKITSSGLVTTLAPAGAVGDVMGVAADNAGNVFVADVAGHTLRKIASDGTISILAGSPNVPGYVDGIGAAARLNGPWNLTFDSTGAIYFTDNGSHTVRKATPDALPLAILASPKPLHLSPGSTARLSVNVAGFNASYQWKKDGVALPGATLSTYAPASPTTTDNGYYSVVVTNQGSSVESAETILTVEAPDNSAQLINVATRGLVPAGDSLTPGFVLRGTGTKLILVRAVGPTLLGFGLAGALADPRFELAALGGSLVASNDDWFDPTGALATTSAALGAFPLGASSKDSAALASLSRAPGLTGYTVRVSGSATSLPGLVLAEIYDAEPTNSAVRIVNVSTRGLVGTGSNSLVPGFVIGGRGQLQLLIRAVGPGLAPFGVADRLDDPRITVRPLGKDITAASNDNWGGTPELAAAFASVGAFALANDSKDAALLVRLPTGAYTVTVTGADTSTGTALIEIYEVP